MGHATGPRDKRNRENVMDYIASAELRKVAAAILWGGFVVLLIFWLSAQA